VSRIAIFCAALALSTPIEIVVFSPARRASRKILERMVEFIKLLDCGDKIIEYNQETARIKTFNGKSSLIRSFPSKVSVKQQSNNNRTQSNPLEPHTHHTLHIQCKSHYIQKVKK